MNIVLMSQCSKRALTETRRILDQFAERRGGAAWQTAITAAGLDTLRRLLKKSARRNTAVACHWIRGRDHSELLWIVGDASQFNEQGAVPTHTTARNVLRREDENNWHTGEDIYLLTGMAALLHDLGKACLSFQQRLRSVAPVERNLYRHEWISLRLFQAFVGAEDDAGWLGRLIAPGPDDDRRWLDNLQRDGLDQDLSKPFQSLPPLAQALAWLVLTHHRLPVMPASSSGKFSWLGAVVPDFRSELLQQIPGAIDAGWNEYCDTTESARPQPYWSFPDGLPVSTELWRKRAAKLAVRLLALSGKAGKGAWLSNPYVMHVARLSLMLADHHYSGLSEPRQRVQGQVSYPLYANTDRASGRLNQPLDEHLLGVAAHSALVTRTLPSFEQHLPRLTRHRGLRKRSADERYRWQDKAADMASGLRERAALQGAFLVNMASTGCGKTLANARIMYALADAQRGMRCAFALGLRTLTLQTGQVFRDLLKLDDDDLAIRVGGSASRELFEFYERQAEHSGSASRQALLEEDTHVRFEGNEQAHPLLARIMSDRQARALLAAPVLVCTVDHLVPATESQRGGRQIAPMLRLMSGDLVLDEPDDFDLDDLPALARLVHWAGLLGARVLLSSATLPPALIEGLFDAYLDGRRIYQRNRGEQPDRPPAVCCAWFDEHRQIQQDCSDPDGFRQHHKQFAAQRYAWLEQQPVRRRSALLPVSFPDREPQAIRRAFAQQAYDAAARLHALHHSIDPVSGKRVSFGLLRMANIGPIFDVALALYQLGAQPGQRIHLCTYHSQYPLLIRSAIERRLDSALNRRQSQAVFSLPDVRQRLDRYDEPDQLFVVLASPVAEVGRDHDYDWAVVEPSSMRSLIQLAGRIRRHRPESCEEPNLLIFDSNLRHAERSGDFAFCQPGFENKGLSLNSHSLQTLLAAHERETIDARPRILARGSEQARPRDSLVDLEHAQLRRCISGALPERRRSARSGRDGPSTETTGLGAQSWWQAPQAMLSAVLQQQQPFRADRRKYVDLVLLPDPAKDDEDYCLHRIDGGPQYFDKLYIPVEGNQNHRVADACLRGTGIAPWGELDYMQVLTELAAQLDLPLRETACRYGTLTLPVSSQGWRSHPVLGFVAVK